ncbi:TPA: hypothetical protein QDC03_003292 [Burkholderia cepacia]|uniref:hypothetical protein n=1 Tax=Burkholderia cepacia TaxID=292 RepID=UPI0011B258D4|nr:hypothetical protein [Burkholderia cepacia]HDR9508193.1 hypothetical protein [Burkholderia cepacia]
MITAAVSFAIAAVPTIARIAADSITNCFTDGLPRNGTHRATDHRANRIAYLTGRHATSRNASSLSIRILTIENLHFFKFSTECPRKRFRRKCSPGKLHARLRLIHRIPLTLNRDAFLAGRTRLAKLFPQIHSIYLSQESRFFSLRKGDIFR